MRQRPSRERRRRLWLFLRFCLEARSTSLGSAKPLRQLGLNLTRLYATGVPGLLRKCVRVGVGGSDLSDFVVVVRFSRASAVTGTAPVRVFFRSGGPRFWSSEFSFGRLRSQTTRTGAGSPTRARGCSMFPPFYGDPSDPAGTYVASCEFLLLRRVCRDR